MNLFSRRRFLQTSGTALAAAAIYPQILFGQPKKKIGVCLVGLGGYSSGQLAPALQMTKHCKLAGIATGSPHKIPIWKEQYKLSDKNIYNYENLPEIANNPDIDAVYIVVPTGLHAKYAIIAANAGKHVWCEKPMAITSAECKAIIDACKKNKVQLAIGYRMHHEPNTQQFIKWGREKPFGKIKEIGCELGWDMVPDPEKDWKMSATLGGGYLYDLGVYPINGLRYAAQEEPVSVSAKHVTKRPHIFREVPEDTSFTFEFASGFLGKGRTSGMQNTNFLHVAAESGWYELSPFSGYNDLKGSSSNGHVFKDLIFNQQAKQMDENALAILRKTSPICPGEEGMKDIRILEAINLSASQEGKKIIL